MSTVLKRVFLSTVLMGFLVLGYGGHLAMAGLIIDLAPNSSDSVKLSDLLDGTYDAITVGDKVFDEFVYSTGGIDMPNADNVNVLGFSDIDGNLGISFQGAFMDLPGDGPSNAAIIFTAAVSEDAQAAGWRISDAHLLLGAPGVGESSIFRVDESFEGPNVALHVIASTLGPGEQVLSDWVDFDTTLKELRITKGIYALAGNNATSPALASVVNQSFSQVQIPEPATLSLLTMSLVGVLLASRHRRE